MTTAIRDRRQWPLPKQADPDAPLLEVRDLAVRFSMPDSACVRAVDTPKIMTVGSATLRK